MFVLKCVFWDVFVGSMNSIRIEGEQVFGTSEVEVEGRFWFLVCFHIGPSTTPEANS